MTGCESVVQNHVERMLHVGETLARVIGLIVNMYIVVHDGVAYILREAVLSAQCFVPGGKMVICLYLRSRLSGISNRNGCTQ